MLKEIRFALYAIKKNIQNSAELRASFLINVLGMAVNNCSFIIMWAFFIKTVGVIGGWDVADIIGLQGFSAIAYGTVIAAALGILDLPNQVSSGSFDRFMLSPKNLIVRAATADFGVQSIGDVLFGVICLVVFGFLIKISLLQLLIMLILIASAVVIFFAFMLCAVSLSFFFINADPVVDGVFEFFFLTSVFHGGVFRGTMRVIFTFVIPSLLVGTLPVEAVRNISFNTILLIVILTILWLLVSIKVFNKSVKRYESSNLMTFGG